MTSIFGKVKDAPHLRLAPVIPELLPGGRRNGREYVCCSSHGWSGDSCKITLDTGKGADFSTGEIWGREAIGLWVKVRGIYQSEAARELADKYGIHLEDAIQASKVVPYTTPILPVPDSTPEPPRIHPQYGQTSNRWRYADMEGCPLAYSFSFDLLNDSKIIPSLCYDSSRNSPLWHWKALPVFPSCNRPTPCRKSGISGRESQPTQRGHGPLWGLAREGTPFEPSRGGKP